MTRKSTLIIGSLVGIALIAAVPLVAGRVGGKEGCMMSRLHGGFGGSHGFGELHGKLEELNLTGEQKDALHSIMRQTRENNAAARQALHQGFTEAAQVLLKDPNNLAGAKQILDQNAAAIEQMKASMLAGVSEGLKVLTPEQREKLAGWVAEHAKAEQ